MSHDELEEAKTILENMAKGINPISGERIEEGSFLNNAQIIRCIYHVVEVLNIVKNGSFNSKKTREFIITQEQKKMVTFPLEKIGMAKFSTCINNVLDLHISKKVTAIRLNKGLKKLEILSEEKTQDGKKRTITNENSEQYGFESERRSHNGKEYDMVLINNNGKKYLLENIELLMREDDLDMKVIAKS